MINKRRVILYLLPLLIFLTIIAFLYTAITQKEKNEDFSVLQGQRFPDVAYKGALIDGVQYDGFSSRDLLSNKLSIVNIWASWCTPCRAEHEFLIVLNQKLIPIYGINYKDKLINAKNFLNELGDPYTAIGFDEDGLSAINLGIYGIPETFIIDKSGIILKKYIGPITSERMKEIEELYDSNI
tara:strand:+ start:34374 stop:34922 length:549 start_codon:yes stop_codon:yes gene_type:complete